MKLLADENTHRRVVINLRSAGFEVEWIRESSPGAQDHEILARPDIASQILITNDRDFGDLIFNQTLPRPYAILYCRIPHLLHELTTSKLIKELQHGQFSGQMVTLSSGAVRRQPFPQKG